MQLSAVNTSMAINVYATSVIETSYAPSKSAAAKLQDLYRKTRKEFRKHRTHNTQTAIERFYRPQNDGGTLIPNPYERNYRTI